MLLLNIKQSSRSSTQWWAWWSLHTSEQTVESQEQVTFQMIYSSFLTHLSSNWGISGRRMNYLSQIMKKPPRIPLGQLLTFRIIYVCLILLIVLLFRFPVSAPTVSSSHVLWGPAYVSVSLWMITINLPSNCKKVVREWGHWSIIIRLIVTFRPSRFLDMRDLTFQT